MAKVLKRTESRPEANKVAARQVTGNLGVTNFRLLNFCDFCAPTKAQGKKTEMRSLRSRSGHAVDFHEFRALVQPLALAVTAAKAGMREEASTARLKACPDTSRPVKLHHYRSLCGIRTFASHPLH